MLRIATTRSLALSSTTQSTASSRHVRHGTFWSRFTNLFKVFAGGEETPRQAQERHDLGMAILSATHYQLRAAAQQHGVVDTSQDEELIDEAIQLLETHDMDNEGIVGLRFELQNLLGPEINKLFETFDKVDRMLKDSKTVQDYNHDTMLKSILRNDYVDALATRGGSTEDEFYQRKRNALQTLLSFQGWSEGGTASTVSDKDETNKNSAKETTNDNDVLDDSLLDDFGYNPSQSTKDVNEAIRQHQTLNMCRSALIKKELDYSTVALKSTIPGAGRGIFIDGHAMAGSLVAFFPGEVWPKEHLMGTASLGMQKYFAQDKNYQLSLRYDDICIDSRRSPYTNLSEKNSNPWAIAHICNHPTPGTLPNCRTVMVNYTQEMNLKSLSRYIPNTYAREPMLLGPKALDRQVILMHGMALMAIRDVHDEELFYDYRLSGPDGSHPSWYHVVNPQEVKNRWSHDKK